MDQEIKKKITLKDWVQFYSILTYMMAGFILPIVMVIENINSNIFNILNVLILSFMIYYGGFHLIKRIKDKISNK